MEHERKPKDHKNSHHSILATLVKKGATVGLTLMNGMTVQGVITQFDSYTITLQKSTTSSTPRAPETYYKHGILSFTAL